MMISEALHSGFIIREGIQGVGVFTAISFKKGDILFKMEGEVVDHPSRTSVQIGEQEHIEDPVAGHVNHNCQPNAAVDRKTRSFISLRSIQAGEEITFDYNQNEDLLASPFACACCGKEIFGRIFVI